jgi:hypothetical protein
MDGWMDGFKGGGSVKNVKKGVRREGGWEGCVYSRYV